MPTKILVLKKLSLKNATLLVGLPGIGLVGKISVDYLLKELKPERVAEVLSDSFPPSVHTKDSKIFLIKNDIFYFKHKEKIFVPCGTCSTSTDMKFGAHKNTTSLQKLWLIFQINRSYRNYYNGWSKC